MELVKSHNVMQQRQSFRIDQMSGNELRRWNKLNRMIKLFNGIQELVDSFYLELFTKELADMLAEEVMKMTKRANVYNHAFVWDKLWARYDCGTNDVVFWRDHDRDFTKMLANDIVYEGKRFKSKYFDVGI